MATLKRPRPSGIEPVKGVGFLFEECKHCGKTAVMVPILLYSRVAFGIGSTPIGKLGKVYCWYCVECHEPAATGNKEDAERMKLDPGAIGEETLGSYYFALGNGFQRLWYMDPSIAAEAARLLLLATKSAPEVFMPYNCLCVLEMNRGRDHKALKYGELALERAKDPSERGTALFNMANSLPSSMMKEAAALLRRSLAEEEMAEHRYDLGCLLQRMGRHEEAIAEFERFMASDDEGNKLTTNETAQSAIDICNEKLAAAARRSDKRKKRG